MTWHEDREIAPGVPDISYVMKGDNCETGWLELKAEDAPTAMGRVSFKLRPQQHWWTEEHHSVCPVHFLCAVGGAAYLVPGKDHRALDSGHLTVLELERLSLLKVSMANADHEQAGLALRRVLRTVTLRRNNAGV